MKEKYKNLSEPVIIETCPETGICTTDPILSAIEELFLNEIRQITYYLVKSKDFGFEDLEAEKTCIEALSMEFASSELNEEYLKSALEELSNLKEKTKNNYSRLSKNSVQGLETINFTIEINPEKPLNKLLKDGEFLIQNKSKTLESKKIQYFELINVVCKICAQNIIKINSYEPDYKKNNFNLLKFFSLTNLYYIKCEKLKRKIKEFSAIIYEIREKTNEVIATYYGQRKECNIQTTLSKGSSILISGGDLKELETLLIATKDESINIYTHGELLIAHSYEKFKKYKNLKGHYDTGYLKCDFSNFGGVIYITKFMSQKIEQIYKGMIFSAEKVTPRGVVRNIENNFENIIAYSKKYKREEEYNTKNKARLMYDIEAIDKVFVEKNNNIVVFVGGNSAEKFLDNFGEKKVINLHYQTDSDLLHHIIKKSEINNAPLIFFFSKCTKRTITMITSLINRNVETIYLIKCPISNMSPHVVECLKNNFEVKIIN